MNNICNKLTYVPYAVALSLLAFYLGYRHGIENKLVARDEAVFELNEIHLISLALDQKIYRCSYLMC